MKTNISLCTVSLLFSRLNIKVIKKLGSKILNHFNSNNKLIYTNLPYGNSTFFKKINMTLRIK